MTSAPGGVLDEHLLRAEPWSAVERCSVNKPAAGVGPGHPPLLFELCPLTGRFSELYIPHLHKGCADSCLRTVFTKLTGMGPPESGPA